MSRRERILTALVGGVPDRPPISFDSHGKALEGVLQHYGASDKNDLYRVAGIDGFSVWEWNAVMGRPLIEQRFAPDGTPLDFWGNAGQHHFGLFACDTGDALRQHNWPRVDWFDFSHVAKQCEKIRRADMVVSAGHLGLGYQMHNMLRGNEKALMDVLDDEWMRVYLENMEAFTLSYLAALLEAGQGRIEVVRADDDVGTMDRLMISPAVWRNYYKPVWKKAFDMVHHYGARVWFHSCGHIAPLMDDLIEIGVDCWNPFPEYVVGNDHTKLAEWRRGRLVLDGGISHLTLVHGSPEQVAAESRQVLEVFAADGGLLIGPSQVLTEDMPLENIVAMFDTILSYKQTPHIQS